MKRNVHKYTDKLKALVIKEAIEMGLQDIRPTADKYGIPKATLHGWLFPNGKKEALPMPDNTLLVLQKLNELNDKIDKLAQAWEIK